MKNYSNYFYGKKITIMGLGLLGRGVNVARFLAECDAELVVTDLKSKEELKSSIKKLKKFKNIKFVLARHRLQDFISKDFIIKAAGVPLDSVYIKEAKKNKIPIEMDASLFVKLADGVKIIGITGTKGKSTTTQIIYEILKKANMKVHLGGNVKGLATLPLLKKIKKGDMVILELDSWQLQGFGSSKISPNIAIFTNFMRDHMNYYSGNMAKYFSDKRNIYKFQKKDDYLICERDISRKLKTEGKKIVVKKDIIPKTWKIKILGGHNLSNIALSLCVADILCVDRNISKKVIENYSGVTGRLEYIKSASGVKYFNDTTATTPDATIIALHVLRKTGNIILIAGGADKNLHYKKMVDEIINKTKLLILLPGTATDKIIKLLPKNFKYFLISDMKKALEHAVSYSNTGDTVLLSPGAASFGVFKNEFDRGEQFANEVRKM